MKKLFSIILILLSLQGIAQTTKIFNTTYPNGLFGRKDTQTVTALHNTINEYLTSFGTWGKLPDSVRTFFSATSPIFYNSSTGVISSQQFTSTLNGYVPLSGGGTSNFLRADGSWATPAGTATGTVTSIATTSPITGGTITTTGTIGITQATTSTNGYLSSTDWNTFNNKISGIGNIGSGYRWITSVGVNAKTLFAGNGTSADSSSNTNGITIKADTSILATINYVTNHSGGGGTPAGSDTWTQYNNAGAFGADSAFRWKRTGQTTSVQNYTGLSLFPAVTAQANNDTLSQATFIRKFNTNGKSSVNLADLKINNNYLVFDSLGNYYISDGLAVPTTGNAIFIGKETGYASNTANSSVGIGYRAIYNTGTGVKTIAIGYNVAATASGLIAIGEGSKGGALAVNSINIGPSAGGNAPNQTNLGNAAGLSSTGQFGVNLGPTAGYLSTGGFSTNIGQNTGQSSTGTYNNFIGNNVGSAANFYTVTGGFNVAIGQRVTTPTAASVGTLNIGNVLYATGLYTNTSTVTQVAQTAGQIGINTQAPATPAVLDIQSTTKGVLFPRMTTTQRDAITLSTNIIGLTLVSGSGYTNGTYTISFSGGGGSGAAGTVTVAGGIYSSWTISNYGTGYTSAPTATISAGAGSGGSITVIIPDINGLTIFNTTDKTVETYNGAWTSSGTISGSFSGVGTATTVFTVTFGGTQPNTTYKVNVTPTAALSAALFYVTNKTTTTFDVTYLAGLTGTVSFDYAIFQ